MRIDFHHRLPDGRVVKATGLITWTATGTHTGIEVQNHPEQHKGEVARWVEEVVEPAVDAYAKHPYSETTNPYAKA